MSTATSYAQRVAMSRWKARRQELIQAGKWQPFVAAQPVRDHVNRIRAAGMPLRALERHFQLSAHHLDHLLWGSDGGRPAGKVRTETARMLLAYWPKLDDFPDAARIDAAGTRRRIQALQVRGFNLIAIAGKAGVASRYFQKLANGDRVTARVARAVRDVYGAWWNADPCRHGVKEWVAERTRRAAQRAGWQGPLAWDDDTIDDPRAVPVTDAPAPAATDGENLAARWLMGESVILDAAARKEALLHLYEWTTLTGEEIADRLETTPAAAEQTWNRAKRKAREEGRRLWRRVYVPQERQIKQDEMGEAA